MSMKNFNDAIGNRIHDVPTCSALPQPTAPPRAPRLWGTASNSNTEVLQRYQNKVLRAIVNALWHIPNKILHTHLKVSTVREEITKFSVKYRDKITTHPNELVATLLEEEEEPRRLERFKPTN
jgi:hypothetical protein